jgi:xanthine dehydrogenase YagR molybdenum-binding subunit
MTTTTPAPAIRPAAPSRPRPDAPESGPWVGRPVDRRDGPTKTTGTATFSAEYQLPDLAHGWLVHAPIARARITAIDDAAARAHPGVLTVLSHLNTPRLKPSPARPSLLDMSTMVGGTRVDYLGTDEVFFDGQPVAVVVAESLEAAQYAASLVQVDYAPLPAAVDFAAAAAAGRATPVKQSLGMPTLVGSVGDADAALGRAAHVVDLHFTTPGHNHNALEPHATTAVWDGHRVTVWDATQGIDWFRKHLALRFDVPVESVRVIAPFVGGGFGGKGSVWAGTLLTVLAARVTGRPVRMALSREAVNRVVGGRTPTRQRVALGADADGRLTSVIHEAVLRNSPVGGGPEQVVGASGDLYASPHVRLATSMVTLDLVPNTFMRAPGESTGSFALESAVDQLAHDLGVDPLELRLRNEPETSALHHRAFSHRRIRELLHVGAEAFGWADRTPGGRRDGSQLVGHGLALAYHPAWEFPANVTLLLRRDGTALLRCGFQEMGMGTATIQAQVVADALGIPFDAVHVDYGDSDLPIAPNAGGSTQSASIAAAVLRSAAKLRRAVSRLHQRPGESLAQTLTRVGRDVEVSVGSDVGVGAAATSVRFIATTLLNQRRWVRAASGAHFCEVRVDADTGEVRVTRWVGAFDIGTVLNAKTAASQLRGGIVMGLGLALTEETVVDGRTGRIMNAGLADYHVPTHADVPHIDIHLLDDPDPTMPLGVLGAGEVGITGVGAAIANAVFDATGRRVTDLPLTLDRVAP